MNHRADLDTSLPECDNDAYLLGPLQWNRAHAPVLAALYALFPHGYGQQACRIAGMRKPLKLMLDV